MTIPALRVRNTAILLLGLCCWLQASAEEVPPSAAVRQLFAQPPREFSSAPLWVWNDALTEQQIVETMRDLAGQQVKQVFVHPRPGLMTPYLSEEWFKLWKVALAEANRLDMNVWIYDENSYPSGFAGGFVPEAMPESRGRGLDLQVTKTPPKWTEGMLAVFRLGGESVENLTSSVQSGQSLPDGHTYLVATIRRAADSPWHGGRSYVDLLYPGVTEKFLDITLGAYERQIGQELGRRVPGIFTDEPNLIPAGGLPWTEDLPEQFQRRWGYSLLENLPSLRLEIGDWQRVRHNYFALLNQLFIERWAKPYAARCEKLGLEMTGHYWEHEWPNCTGVPDNMAMYGWQQRPAIDCLMNQYAENTHAQFGNVRSVRELNSIANQLGKKRTLCEVYGAGGWDLRFEDMKRQADWLAVLGVNTFDQHLSYVTIRGARKRDHPQSFSYHEPWWEAYKPMGTYLERLSVAVSQGAQVNHILVLEPTTTAWMSQGSEARLKPLGDAFFNLLMRLEAVQVEYDLGCEDVIARHGSVRGRALNVGQRAYDTVVLPPLLDNLEKRTWELLDEYVAGGGRVLVCKPLASNSNPRLDGGARASALAPWNERWQRVEVGDVPGLLLEAARADSFSMKRTPDDRGSLFHMRRRLADGELLFLVNTSLEHPTSGRFTSAAKGVEHWDLETGQVRSYAFASSGDGVTANFDLPSCGSLLLFLSKEPRTPASTPKEEAYTLAPLASMTVERLAPNVLVLDHLDVTAAGESRTNAYFYQASQFAFQKNGMLRNPWDSAVQFKDEIIRTTFPAGSGLRATYRFVIEHAVPRDLSIVIERPELYTIVCNGSRVAAMPGAWWLDKAFGRLDLGEVARVGTNEVVLTAAPFTVQHELEPAYVLGDFSLEARERGFVIVPAKEMRLGFWNEQGQPFYAAGVRYRLQFDLGSVPTGPYRVALRNWYGSVAKVVVNGKTAGFIGHAPWQCDVTEQVWNGENTVDIIAIGTLKNTLGPHHGNPALGTAWPGMFQRAPAMPLPPGRDYHTVGYGLIQPFVLQQVVTR